MPNLSAQPNNLVLPTGIDMSMRGDNWKASAKLIENQRWRLNNLYKIVNKDGEVIPFVMNWAQLDYYNRMWHKGIVLKARQLGFSTFFEILALDMVLWRDNFNATIIAHGKEEASKLFSSKILFAYNNLPDAIREWRPAIQQSMTGLTLNNGSKVQVTVSARSGTNQFLHISEFGKICMKYPAKADEIVSGSLETVNDKGLIAVESTAEGHSGPFFDMCERSQNLMYQAKRLTRQDYRFFFYPWHREDNYRASAEDALRTVIPQRLAEYFMKLDQDYGVELDQQQKVWYAKKEETLGTMIFREHPSTPEEAFQAKIKGAYYGDEIARMRLEGRICSVPINPNIPVDTWWDLGYSDYMVIILTQTVGREIHFVDWYMNNGHGLSHYANYLNQLASKGNYRYGTHWGPHDVDHHEIGSGKTRLETASEFGLRFKVSPRRDIMDGIDLVRLLFPWFYADDEKCGELFDMLATYRKEWDANLGAYKNQPLHDESSHPADAFRTGAVMHPFAAKVKLRKNRPSAQETFHTGGHSSQIARTR